MSLIATADLSTNLEGRAPAYRVLANLVGRELTAPDISVLSALAEHVSEETTGELGEGPGSALARLVATLPAAGDEEALIDLAAEYARLFLGAGGRRWSRRTNRFTKAKLACMAKLPLRCVHYSIIGK